MIPRYSRPEMAAIWSPQTRFRIWFEIEAHATDAMAELGVVPKEAARAVWEKGRDAVFDVERIDAIEREVKHDVIAFLTHLAEIVGPEARFVHQGMTSSDVLDTCLTVQLDARRRLLIDDVDAAAGGAEARAPSSTSTRRPSAAATASMPSPRPSASSSPRPMPSSIAQPRAPRAARATRSRPAPSPAPSAPSPTSIRGSRRMSPRRWGCAVEPVSTQVIPRDRHAMYFATLGVVASLGRAPRDRDPPSAAHRGAGGRGVFLRRAEGLLGHAPQAQPGADREPHRARPDGAAPMSLPAHGKCRAVARARHLAFLSRAHDRARCDGHARLRAGAPRRCRRQAGGLSRGDAAAISTGSAGCINSQRVLLALTQAGVSREDAYRMVQRNAMRVWRGEGDFLDFLKADREVPSRLDAEANSRRCSTEAYHFKHVDTIFRSRVRRDERGVRCASPTPTS